MRIKICIFFATVFNLNNLIYFCHFIVKKCFLKIQNKFYIYTITGDTYY